MNNIELEAKFKTISQINNSLDAIIELNKLKKEYKKSDFYKITKLSIFKAYKMSLEFRLAYIIDKVHSISNMEDLAIRINELIDNIDEDTLNSFAEKLSNIMSISQLEEYNKKLGDSINKLKIK